MKQIGEKAGEGAVAATATLANSFKTTEEATNALKNTVGAVGAATEGTKNIIGASSKLAEESLVSSTPIIKGIGVLLKNATDVAGAMANVKTGTNIGEALVNVTKATSDTTDELSTGLKTALSAINELLKAGKPIPRTLMESTTKLITLGTSVLNIIPDLFVYTKTAIVSHMDRKKEESDILKNRKKEEDELIWQTRKLSLQGEVDKAKRANEANGVFATVAQGEEKMKNDKTVLEDQIKSLQEALDQARKNPANISGGRRMSKRFSRDSNKCGGKCAKRKTRRGSWSQKIMAIARKRAQHRRLSMERP